MANDLMAAFVQTPGFPDCRPKPTCDPRPPCPACGGLECLCRPRFFAGQLLTDEDLNRLDYYIGAKNRLHNRHLVGTGVVCGLEVVCSICDPAGNGTVVVRPGYALSPCGNDIVVCGDERVDICDLINRCRPRLPDDCIDVHDRDNADCRAPATSGKTPSGCGCGCGGGAGCTCGGAMTTSKQGTRPKALPAQCEPTLTCEGYTFAVYPAPKKGAKQDPGELVRRFVCCVLPLFERIDKMPGRELGNAELQQWLVELKDAVYEFLISESLYDCDLAARIAAVPLPDPNQDHVAYLGAWNAAVDSTFEILRSILQKCLCAALLPPCAGPEDADCVPIATVTVSRSKCRVRRICNIANRKFLITFPTIEYWLSWLPIFSSGASPAPAPAGVVVVAGASPPTLRDLVEAMCCKPVRNVQPPNPNDPGNIPGVPPGAAPPAGGGGPFGEILNNALKGGGTSVDFANWLLAVMGGKPAAGQPPILGVELANPAQAILIHQILAPLLKSLAGSK